MSEFDAIYDDIWRRLQSGEAPGLSGYDDQLSDLFSQGRLSGPGDIKRLVEMGEEPAAAEPEPEQPDGISEEERHSLSLKMSETAERPAEQGDKGGGESEPAAPRGGSAGDKQSGGSAGLSEDDRRLLLMRLGDLGDAINNKELFGRWAQLKMGYHPDTGEKLNVRKERKSAMQASAAELARNLKKREVDESTPKVPDTTRGESALDVVQTAGDVGGVVDQTGITDALNAMLSIGRAVTDKGRRSEHLQNAAISAVGVIPLIGDLPKLLKLGRTKRNMQAAAGLAGGRRGGVGSGVFDFLGRSVARSNNEGGDAGSVVRDAFESMTGDGGSSGGGPPPDPPPGGTPPMGDDPGRGSGSDDIEGARRSKDAAKGFTDQMIDMALIVGKVTAGLVAMFEGVRLVNKGNLFLSQHLTKVNAEIARAEAMREIAGVRRDIREGETMSGAFERASEADIAIEDVRSRFVTPVRSMFMDLTAAGTRAAASLVDAADSATLASEGLKTASQIFGNVMEASGDAAEGFFQGLMKTFGGSAAKIAEHYDNARGSDEGLPWYRLLNDLSDGKFDGKSDAGEFFGVNGKKKP